MKRKTKWRVFAAVTAVVIIGLCAAAWAISRTAAPASNTTQGSAIIDWVDFVRWNGQLYTRLHSAALTDTQHIGSPLGKVGFRLEGQVTNPHYEAKDGDAAFLDEGTTLYEVKGYSSGALIAAPSPPEPNGYRLYAVRDKNPDLFKALEPGKSNKAPKQLQLLT